MSKYWSDRFLGSKWAAGQENGVVVHGEAEPILSVLDVRGFDVRDFFLIGSGRNCGSIIVETESRAENIRAALEPAYSVNVVYEKRGEWWTADFDRREMDGTVPSWFLTDITLNNGRQVMKNGRWV